MRIGIIGAADIAFRRFLPALERCGGFVYAGVASRSPEKARRFAERCGGTVYPSYQALLEDQAVEAVYIALPPALHAEWGRRALLAGKHLLMEKPFTVSPEETEALLRLAGERGLAVHENYMFLYHSQLAWIEERLRAGAVGEPRLLRAAFGFPFRGAADFRYERALGGGALLDCGGYPVRLAARLLGPGLRVSAARLSRARGLEVDVYGSATLEDGAGRTAQIAFGMDNSYKCELELWGSEGCLTADRIFTAPPDFSPSVRIRTAQGERTCELPPDDAFLRSIQAFSHKISRRGGETGDILGQSALIEQIRKKGTSHDSV